VGNVTVIDVETEWYVDATFFLTLALGFLVWWGGAALVGGLFAGTGIARLMGVRRLHHIEQAGHMRLSVGLGRGQRRKPTFYARPDLGI